MNNPQSKAQENVDTAEVPTHQGNAWHMQNVRQLWKRKALQECALRTPKQAELQVQRSRLVH